MQLTPIRGFINTPVTRIICITATIVAVAISIFQFKYLFVLSIDPFILEFNQYWRILTFQASVINESDYLLTVILWFHFKTVERFYGSKKYLSLIIVLALYNAMLTFLIMSLGQLLINFINYSFVVVFNLGQFNYKTTILNSVVAGPIGIISSLYVCYGTYIPISYQFKLLLSDPKAAKQPEHNNSKELLLTDHFQIHIVYTLLLINNGFKSIIPGLVGLFIGKLYTNELLPGARTWLIPNSLFRWFISPIKSVNGVLNSVRRRVGNYNDIDEEPEEHEEPEEVIDERNEQHEIRAETPVRPLASQFLNTFRTDT